LLALFHNGFGVELKQVFTIEDDNFEFAGIQIFEATEVDARKPGHAQHFIVRVNTAFLAKVMLRNRVAELVKADVIFIRIDIQFPRRDRLGVHHRAFTRTNRTATAQTAGDFFAFKIKLDGAAMAAPMVMLWHIFLLPLLSLALFYRTE